MRPAGVVLDGQQKHDVVPASDLTRARPVVAVKSMRTSARRRTGSARPGAVAQQATASSCVKGTQSASRLWSRTLAGALRHGLDGHGHPRPTREDGAHSRRSGLHAKERVLDVLPDLVRRLQAEQADCAAMVVRRQKLQVELGQRQHPCDSLYSSGKTLRSPEDLRAIRRARGRASRVCQARNARSAFGRIERRVVELVDLALPPLQRQHKRLQRPARFREQRVTASRTSVPLVAMLRRLVACSTRRAQPSRSRSDNKRTTFTSSDDRRRPFLPTALSQLRAHAAGVPRE